MSTQKIEQFVGPNLLNVRVFSSSPRFQNLKKKLWMLWLNPCYPCYQESSQSLTAGLPIWAPSSKLLNYFPASRKGAQFGSVSCYHPIMETPATHPGSFWMAQKGEQMLGGHCGGGECPKQLLLIFSLSRPILFLTASKFVHCWMLSLWNILSFRPDLSKIIVNIDSIDG